MNDAAIAVPLNPGSESSGGGQWAGVDQIAIDYAAPWLEQCRSFLRWHREQLIRKNSAPGVVEVSDRLHPWMIRVTRLMHCQLLDPDFAHPELAREVEAMLWQLEEACAQTHNPMSEEEADALIADFFPSNAS